MLAFISKLLGAKEQTLAPFEHSDTSVTILSKIEAGKFYRTRDGENVCGPMGLRQDRPRVKGERWAGWPYYWDDHTCFGCWDLNGRSRWWKIWGRHRDLVEECEGPNTIVAEMDAKQREINRRNARG